MAPRFAWPLFGLATVPEVPAPAVVLARTLLANGARYVGDEASHWHSDEPPWLEMAVVGRSNVGKSTLLNALLGSRDNKFVPVSRHPGSTRHLEFYGVGSPTVSPAPGSSHRPTTTTTPPPAFVLVDSPGYGYNSHGKAAGDAWSALITAYLQRRNPAILPRTLLLLDARVGLTAGDETVLDLFDAAYSPYHVVLTKADTVTPAALEATVANLAARLARRALPFPVINAVSARTGAGMATLKQHIMWSSKAYRQPDLARLAARTTPRSAA